MEGEGEKGGGTSRGCGPRMGLRVRVVGRSVSWGGR